MTSKSTVTDRDLALAKAINEEARANPNSPYAGKYVGIIHGKVVAVADDLKSVINAMADVDPDPTKGVFIEASADYTTPQEIWWN